MKKYIIVGLLLSLFACNRFSKPGEMKPYFFDRSSLDKLVKEKKALSLMNKREDSTLLSEKFFLGDTVQYELWYDKGSNLELVNKRNEHGMLVQAEYYYPSGQRKALYHLKSIMEPNIHGVYDGIYFIYFEDGKIKEKGEYKNDTQIWSLAFDKEGYARDTTVYDYKDQDIQKK